MAIFTIRRYEPAMFEHGNEYGQTTDLFKITVCFIFRKLEIIATCLDAEKIWEKGIFIPTG
jgi:hypothetical protein